MKEGGVLAPEVVPPFGLEKWKSSEAVLPLDLCSPLVGVDWPLSLFVLVPPAEPRGFNNTAGLKPRPEGAWFVGAFA